MTPIRVTVKIVAGRFCTTDKTVRRWIDEGKEIIDPFTNELYRPGKDPAGNWIFEVTPRNASEKPDELRHPAPARRRILSTGIK